MGFDKKLSRTFILPFTGKALEFSVVNALEEPIQTGLKETGFAPLENKFIKLKP